MIDIPMPRLIDGKTLEYKRTIRPIKATVELNITPLSTASLELPEDETLNARDFVEMFTAQGSAGIYRIRSPQNSYGDEESSVSELEHAITEVGDYLVTADFDEMMPAQEAMKAVFSYYRGKLWKLGSISALSREIAVNVQYENVLTAMLGILEQIPPCYLSFDFSTKPWTVNISRRGTSVSAEGRLSRNVQSARIVYDDSELCTRAYFEYDTGSDDDDSTAWASKDADTLSKWGVVERKVSTGSDYTYNEALILVDDYLEKHKNPKISIEISAEDLSSVTGETFDKFQIGKLCRLALPAYGVTVEENITAISWDDVYGNPTSMSIQLGEEEVTAVSFIHESETSSSESSKSSSRSSASNKEEFKRFSTKFEKQDTFIELTAQEAKSATQILRKAGIYLDSNGTLIYADEYDEETGERTLGSKFKVQNDLIYAEVESRKKGEAETKARLDITDSRISAKVSKGGVATELAVECGNVSITGGNLVVDGYVTTKGLQTAIGNLGTLVAKSIIISNGGSLTTTGYVACSDLKTSKLTLGGNAITKCLVSATVSNNKLTLVDSAGRTTTFSKATTLSGEWSGTLQAGKSYKAEAKQGDVVVGTLTSPRIYDIAPVELTKKWASNYKSFTQTYRVRDSAHEDLYEETITFLTTDSYNRGWRNATQKFYSPTSSSNLNRIDVSGPPSTVDGDTISRSYFITGDSRSDEAYIMFGGTQVAKVVHGAYTQGKADGEQHTFAGYFTKYGTVSVEGQTYTAYITQNTSANWSHKAVYV